MGFGKARVYDRSFKLADDRDVTIDRLRTKVGELTMDAELLHAKIERLEVGGGGAPLAPRRSKR